MIKRGNLLIAGCPLSGVEAVVSLLGEEEQDAYDLSCVEWSKKSGLFRLSFVRDPFSWLEDVWKRKDKSGPMRNILSELVPDSLRLKRWEDWIFCVYGEEGVALWSEMFGPYLEWADSVMRMEDLPNVSNEFVRLEEPWLPAMTFRRVSNGFGPRRSSGLSGLVWSKEGRKAMEFGYCYFVCGRD